jgi:PAS domain S-box-containing protein
VKQRELSRQELTEENRKLRERLWEAEQTIQAIQSGEVDALIIHKPGEDRIYTLTGADHGYRVLVESITEGALILSPDDSIYYCNRALREMLGLPVQNIIAGKLDSYVVGDARPRLVELIKESRRFGAARGEFLITRGDGTLLPVNVSLNCVSLESFEGVCGIITDLSEQKRIEEDLRGHRTELERLVEERTEDLARANSHLLLELTERKRAEEGLRESEERLRLAQGGAGIGVWDLNPRTGEHNRTPELNLLYGTDPETISTYHDWRKRVHPDDIERFEAERDEAIARHEPFTLEFRFFHSSGEIRWMAVRGRAIYDEAGEAVRVLGVNIDITERKQAEDELRKRELEFRALVENSPDMIVRVGKDLRRIYVNPAIVSTFGLTPAEFVGTRIPEEDEVKPDKREHARVVRSACKRVFSTGEEVVVEYSYPTPKGIRYFQGRLIPEYGESGEIETLLTISRDITERKRMEEAIRESEKQSRTQAIRLKAVLDAAPAIILTAHDRECRTILGNRAASEFSRVAEGVNMSKTGPEPGWLAHYRIFHGGRELAPEDMPIQRVAATGEPLLDYLVEYVFDNGARHFLLGNIVPFLDKEGRPEGAVAAFLDITERRRESEALRESEEALRQSRDELEMRVQRRTAALEKANEELRQIPSKLIAVQEEERRRLAIDLHDSIGQTLAAVKFWIEMALKLRDEGDGIGALGQLERFIPILQRSIEETRSIYMGLRPSMLDNIGLLATLDWLRGECMRLYPQRHIELETKVAEEEIPENLKVNIFRIAQEALNNIAKHSEAEWVDIALSGDECGIGLVISDDGVGMDLDMILQTNAVKSLGLTSMRERAELGGGTFTIDSTPGEGTTIRAFWPIEAEDLLQEGETPQ